MLTERYDVVVVGGGLAAVCAALQAARLGCTVVLLEKDQVLGGNAGPLLGVHVSGAHSFHPYASELGLIGEIIEEAAWQRAKLRTYGQHYNISQQFEDVLSLKLREAGVTVYRRTYGRDVEMGGARIAAVLAEDTARYLTLRLEAAVGVIDGSGDGQIAWRAGADYRQGREAQAETGERSAGPVADTVTLGTSVTALCRKASRPVEFIPPPGTPPYEDGYGRAIVTDGAGRRIHRFSSWHPDDEFCFLWITETGGQLDTVADEHQIREELLGQVYSTWAALKAEEPAAANWELIWISPKCGKRESRRFLGDVVVSQTDVEAGQEWPDAVCFGGYSVDIHNPAGRDNRQVEIVFYSVPPLWGMPYRALYSRNVPNLWLAGRLASVTHLGLGSWRLMRTLASGGQAVGAAAAVARRHGCDNRTVYQQHLAELQQTILRHDGAMPTQPAADPLDLAPAAVVTASSESRHGELAASTWLPLDRPRAAQLWDWQSPLQQVEVYLRNQGAATAVPCRLTAHRPERPWGDDQQMVRFDYEPVGNRMEWGSDNRCALFQPLTSGALKVPAGYEGWVPWAVALDLPPVDATSDEPRLNLELDPVAGVEWACDPRRVPYLRRLEREAAATGWRGSPDAPLVRLTPAPAYGEARQVVNGWNRRWSTNPLHAWQAGPGQPLPQTLTLTWPTPQTVGLVLLTFDTLTRAYREMPFDCEQRVSPMCVADYRLEATADGATWQPLLTVQQNYARHRRHRLPPARWLALRLVVERVWDDSHPARVYEVRVYAQEPAEG
ncbi:MAG: FAD-dependent oxidoreductase [Fimbriimonadaceae bacterium]|nr:FAD-dependent oxidoreductase [Fimbriimonadaceae bacterium]